MSSADEKLCDATERGDVAEIERQIAAGANPDAVDGTIGWTPLQMALHGGHIAAITALVKAGANADRGDSMGWTPLRYAVSYSNMAAIEALAAAGADVNLVMSQGDTVLQSASVCGRVDGARMLLEVGARADMCDKRGRRPIDVVRAPFAPVFLLCTGIKPLVHRHAATLPCAGVHWVAKHGLV
jgi:uncharacterized protein